MRGSSNILEFHLWKDSLEPGKQAKTILLGLYCSIIKSLSFSLENSNPWEEKEEGRQGQEWHQDEGRPGRSLNRAKNVRHENI